MTNGKTRLEMDTAVTNKSSHNISKEVLDDSLKGISEKLEEMERINETRFRKTFEKNREQCKETEKRIREEIKEAMKLQHRETRRRLERLEKKTNSGSYD